MSAYGTIATPQPTGSLPILSFPLPSAGLALVTYPVTGADAPEELLRYFYTIFSNELESGCTYPQEGPITYEEFISYFFAATTIVGVIRPVGTNGKVDMPGDLESARAGRTWEECIGGCYYIKPNYPGRSSHNCNAGFIVPTTHRGKKLGIALGKSYLEYAPRLGYRGSVFNLVYTNNIPSLSIWDQLGFQRVGVIPNAGRLKTGPNGNEEYVDAVIVYKSFV
ncbi:hypothetical protein I307_05402 [Cryptococcus deuterogattii 99/473]|uniref:N-acetyltransferase domain-containing protein n=2 Tax=Cryptococcus deuterogattii TaxID=1859096 RepID=A0A0D0T4B0_9TREE|nr:hypothetical protein CNBG_0280 [Cryptococcus deuterogattii R265]KIR25731.1 hypothetical protein I309_05427 [Cryptococcus deuterogattii LA55]KIR40602.1 hypothetical protein I313_03253 [Cryptococcus deuterogattii Ram5]KIR74283.1 hypothetical protein I310_01885 [Cryptococcus deuterogattii CA1014]KIR94230.1 hypothetical protein I304_01867 [Cryptococcus deuterogattii CBS 10090]KIS01237.1 hypothetical protein L804_01111 [Cryptococcus deuterogattii 2001/935-1]KIY55253.1 hypothetical protein I307_